MAKRLPVARKSGLATEQVADELLVYDLERDKAYCLNHTAAQVWKRCDGRTSPEEIAKRLSKELGAELGGQIDEKVVWCALEQLGRDRLLEDRLALPVRMAWVTRRQHLRTLGKVAAVAVPVVTAMIAPTPAMATSRCGRVCTNTTGALLCPGRVCKSHGTNSTCCNGTCPDPDGSVCP
jgi:hypothetical protein